MLYAKLGGPSSSVLKGRSSVEACTLQFVCAIVLLVRYSASRKRSHLFELSLLCFTVCDIFRTHTTWRLSHSAPVHHDSVIAVLQATATAAYGVLLSLATCFSESPDPRFVGLVAKESDASLLSLLFLSWLNPLVSFGLRNRLSQDDVARAAIHHNAIFTLPDGETDRPNVRSPTTGLLRQLIRRMPLRIHLLYMGSGLLSIMVAAVTLCQPLIIRGLVGFLQGTQHSSAGAWLVVALFFTFLTIALLQAQGTHLLDQAAYRVRGFLIYRIHTQSIQPVDHGVPGGNESAKVTVLANVDVPNFISALKSVFPLVNSAITVGVGGYMLYQVAGLAFLGPLVLSLLSIAVPVLLGPRLARCQRATLEATEKRLRSMSQIVSNIRSVRIGGVLSFAGEEVLSTRQLEIAAAKLYRKIFTFVGCAADSVNGLSLLATFGLYTVTKGASTLEYTGLFTALSLIAIMVGPFLNLVQMLPDLYEGYVSWKRLSHFLAFPRITDTGGSRDKVKALIRAANPELIAFARDCSLGWTPEAVLHGLTLNIVRGSITVIAGETGLGKSTLLKSLVGEVRVLEGFMNILADQVSYCDQDPFFLPGGTVREQILWGNDLDLTLYSAVLRACQLDADVERWRSRDSQVISTTEGAPLSGGQRKRISLARALYHNPELLILDDVFTGIDSDTTGRMRDALFGPGGFLQTRLSDMAVVMSSSSADVEVLKNTPFRVLDVGNFTTRPQKIEIITEKEPSELLIPGKSSEKPEVSEQATIVETAEPPDVSSLAKEDENDAPDLGPVEESQSLKKDMIIYLRSLGALGVTVVLLLTLLKCIADKGSAYFLSYWAGQVQAGDTRPVGFWLGIFCGIIAGALLLTLSIFWLFFMHMIPKSALGLHEDMIQTLLRAPTSFIESRSSEILNRFIQDVGVIDLELPQSFLNTVFALCFTICSIIVLAISSPYTLVSLCVSVILIWYIGSRYVATSSQLRTLQIAAAAPMVEFLRAGFDGRCTIRAFGFERQAALTLLDRLNHSQKSAYLFRSLQAWLTLLLDLIATGVAVTLASLLVGLKSKTNVGWAGVALVNTIVLSQELKLLIHWITTFEVAMGAIQRIREFITLTPSEDDGRPDEKPNDDWPLAGEVKFENFTCCHGDTPILKNVTITINPGEKVAIIGRTGSGKSSLVQSLFNLLPRTQGTISIDGVNLDTVPSPLIRERLVGLPQFTICNSLATLRRNLDPSRAHSDAEITAVLDKVFADVKGAGSDTLLNLDQVWERCEFSQGWQQRLGIVRMLLRRGRVWVFDEATSGMDRSTHERMMEVVFEAVKGGTVIFVTHHVEDLRMFDRVLEVRKGVVSEREVGRGERGEDDIAVQGP
ncbi:hypothetical protein B0T16DRAFT_410658 [Cercophora newfieldiana]|uniref:ABC transporter n=1 Tax=Cercophora newfieldiana TaxID=92897 RepID=A0AA39YD87_9PEZI|nr:hypothetical protein B0T16DRAFT_410658 [Cercophora newfieldiana]